MDSNKMETHWPGMHEGCSNFHGHTEARCILTAIWIPVRIEKEISLSESLAYSKEPDALVACLNCGSVVYVDLKDKHSC